MASAAPFNAFVQPVDADVSADEVAGALSAFGPVEECFVPTSQHGDQRTHALVRFADPNAAARAIAATRRDPLVLGHRCTLASVRPYDETRRASHRLRRTGGLHVSNLPDSMRTEGDLEREFYGFGMIQCTIMKQSRAGERFGFVNFARQEDAAAAREAVDGRVVDGVALRVAFSRSHTSRSGSRGMAPSRPGSAAPRSRARSGSHHSSTSVHAQGERLATLSVAAPPPLLADLTAKQPPKHAKVPPPSAPPPPMHAGARAVFIKYLGKDVTESELQYAAEARPLPCALPAPPSSRRLPHTMMYGEVKAVRIVRDDVTLVSRGLAHVYYADDATAQAAVARLHGATLYGRPVVAMLQPAAHEFKADSERSSCQSSFIPASFARARSSQDTLPPPPPAPPYAAVDNAALKAPPSPLVAAPPSPTIAPFYGVAPPLSAAAQMRAAAERELALVGCVAINGTVFFEPPSEHELHVDGAAVAEGV